MQSINFEFLRENNAELSDIGGFAEQYLYTDPSGALVKIRSFGEQLLKNFFYISKIDCYPRSTQMELLQILQERRLAPPVVLDKFHFIRKVGNKAVHSLNSQTNNNTASQALKEAFDLGKWFCLMVYNDCSVKEINFTLPAKTENINELKTLNKTAKLKIAQQETEMAKLLEELETKRQQLESKASDSEIQNLQFAAEQSTSILDYNESETRKLLIDQMLMQVGWEVGANGQDTKDVKVEYCLDGQAGSSGNGYADYVLWDSIKNIPLAVIEAKKTSINAEAGKKQAKMYADALSKKYHTPILIYYTNGYDIYLWNSYGGEIPRKVYGYYNRESTIRILWKHDNTKDLTDLNVDLDIVDRSYQLEAVKRVCEKFQASRRKALIVLATGTGKTRVAIAISEILLRARWAKRILFLCDRRELRKQAYNAFNASLEGQCVYVNSKSYRDYNKSIYIATYPAMIKSFQSFDTGFFDLVIADESHRSIYNRYQDLFLYFDALQVGLTATPRQVISHNTYSMFDCEDDDPTSFYSYEQAVDNGYLAKYHTIKFTTNFLREGIHYKDMSDTQKTQLEEQLAAGAEAVDYDQPQVDREIMNIDTNKKILRNLMENGIKVGSQYIGKTIIFARSHRHAMLLEKLFNEMYPQYNLPGKEFCSVIDNYIERAEQLIDDFKGLGNNSNLTIAISVDMLDTGIDIPEIVNLVFAKPVKSYVKFWQMIGRGTRLCKKLHGPDKDKTEFYIFDHWGNFEYFGENDGEITASVSKSLLQRLFESRIALAEKAIEVQEISAFGLATDLIIQDIQALPMTSISVRDKWKVVEQVKDKNLIKQFDANTVFILKNEIAPLMQWRNLTASEETYKFDLLISRLQTAQIANSSDFDNFRGQVQESISRLPINLSMVAVKKEWLDKSRSVTFWQEASPSIVEQLRHELRDLMQYCERSGNGNIEPLVVDVTDMNEHYEVERQPLNGRDLIAYRSRVEGLLKKLFDKSPALQKIKHGQAVTEEELSELVNEAVLLDPLFSLEDLLVNFPNKTKRIEAAIRQIIGLESQDIDDKFNTFIKAHNLNAYQMRFLDMVKNHISQYGILELEKLYDAPFTSLHGSGIDGVFSNEKQADELMNLIEEINEFAPTV